MRFGPRIRRDVLFAADNGDGAGGGKPGGDGGMPPKDPIKFDEWIAKQPDDIRAAHEEHVKGLKSALQSERDKAAQRDKELKDAEKEREQKERDRQAAAEAALEQQKEFEKLATQRKTKLDELEPQVQTITQERDSLKHELKESREVLHEFLEAELKAINLDEPTKELLTGKSAVEQLRWIAKNREKLTTAKGLPGTPGGTGGNGKLTDDEKRKQAVKIW